ncbi:COG4315 family predicted lipoprotein [Streptomyces spinosirectus]
MSIRRITVAGFALASALALAGCGSSGGGGGGSHAAGQAPAAMDTSTIKVSSSPLGNILTDGSGRTLYLFTEDGKNTNSMNCDAACVRLWPHMEGKPHAGKGVRSSLISATGTGSKAQVTYAGHPLYYYADDHSAGDVKGQGIDKIWYVMNDKGTAVKTAAPASSSTSGSGSGSGNSSKGSGGYGY